MKRILSVTLADCEVQTFRCGGAGGQHRDKTSNGVRIVHKESGAHGESTQDRSQLQNKRLAWRRMVESKEFQVWLKRMLGRTALEEAELNRNVQNRVERDLRRAEQLWDSGITDVDQIFKELAG